LFSIIVAVVTNQVWYIVYIACSTVHIV